MAIDTQQPANPANNTTANDLNIQALPKGFGSYLTNILPEDIGIAAGAFSRTMQQIRNIQGVPIEKFAQVAGTMETNKGLPLTNGTNVPTNITEAQLGAGIVALGSGPYNTYTFSDFFGCMSCLPYPWKTIQSQIQTLTTTKLSNIYNQLFLAVTWDAATVSVQYTTYTGPGPSFDTYYHVTGLTLTHSGGGYGRGTAPAPTISISNGGSGTTTIGTDDTTALSNGLGTFGRVTSVVLASAGTDSTSIPTVTIQCPPTATLAVNIDGSISTSGVNTSSGTSGWPGMNTPVQLYINQANDEIFSIRNTNPTLAGQLNLNWNNIGERLNQEQRARNIGLTSEPPPNTPPAELTPNLNPYPITMYSFIDNVPKYAKNTEPHMSAQTIEAISDTDIVTGQSTIGLMRESRNQDRLSKAGLILDNTIADALPVEQQKQLLANGSLSVPTTITTTDANANVTTTTANVPTPLAYPDPTVIPAGYYDPVTQLYYVTPVVPFNVTIDNSLTPNNISNTTPTANDTGAANPALAGQVGVGIGTPVATGRPAVPGSLGGSPYQSLMPPSLNPYYTSGVLLPATNSVAEAIEQVIACNCDCWVH
jgi:hypothetical protein